MKGCHSCEHAADIAKGKYAGRAWAEVPCAGCNVMSGAGFAIEYDEGRGGFAVGSARLAVGSEEEDLECHEDHESREEERLPVSVMREIVIGLLKLKPELRDVVAWRYAGMKYDDIAIVQGVTRACVEKRHRRAMEVWPALRALFPRKSGKQLMRKPHSKCEA